MSAILLSLFFVLLIVFLLKKHIFYFFNTVVKLEIESLKAVAKRNFDDDNMINTAKNVSSVNAKYQTEINNWKLKNNLKTLRYMSEMEFVYKDENISKDDFQKYKDLKLDLRLRTIAISNRIMTQGNNSKEKNKMTQKNSA